MKWIWLVKSENGLQSLNISRKLQVYNVYNFYI